MKRKRWIFTGMLLIMVLLTVPGCRSSKDSARKYEKMEEKMMREDEKALHSAKKDHVKIQSKATRKMMRDSKKRAKKLNKPKKR